MRSDTKSEQTTAIMTRHQKALLENRSDLSLVLGDVTSTMGCAITTQMLTVKVAQGESRTRSGVWTMPGEINRLVADSISNCFFTTSGVANPNLQRTRVGDERIVHVVNTRSDTQLKQRPWFQAPTVWAKV